MDLRRLTYFARIARDGSLTRAAGVLRIAQPALSRQMRLLESELGVRLFGRTARGMRLTEEGEYLRTATAGPLRALELALQNVRSSAARVEGNFAIGMPSGIGDVLAMPLVARLQEELPAVRLKIIEGATGSLIDWLNRGIIDLALIEETAQDRRLRDRSLPAERLVLVSPATEEPCHGTSIGFREAARLPLILPSHHLGVRAIVNAAAATAGLTLDIRLEAESIPLIRRWVAAGAGHTILPRSYVAPDLADGKVIAVPILNPELHLAQVIATRHDEPLVEHRIERVVIATIRELIEAGGDRPPA